MACKWMGEYSHSSLKIIYIYGVRGDVLTYVYTAEW